MRKLSEDNMILVSLTAFLALLLVLSFKYVPKARLMPLVVGVPTLALVVFCLLVNLVPGFSKRYRRVAEQDVFDLGEIRKKLAPAARKKRSPAEIRRKEMNMIWWLVGLMAAILLLGYLIAIPGFVFLFLKVRSGERWLTTILVTAATWICVYGVFVVLLKLPIYKGILFGA